MIQKLKNPIAAEELFSGWEETLIWSCLDGTMGEIYADDNAAPKCAAAVIGDFCFLAGDRSEQLLRYAVGGKAFVIAVPQTDEWGSEVERCFAHCCKKTVRYAFCKDTHFDCARLAKIAHSLDDGYTVSMIDKKLFDYCSQTEWCRDLVSQYKTFDQYRRLGLGAAVLKNGELVSGASSYTSYRGGIEIEVDTKKEYRQQGLAAVCSAVLITECIKRGLYPSWDAQNKVSAHLAEGLGYTLSHEYTAYEITL